MQLPSCVAARHNRQILGASTFFPPNFMVSSARLSRSPPPASRPSTPSYLPLSLTFFRQVFFLSRKYSPLFPTSTLIPTPIFRPVTSLSEYLAKLRYRRTFCSNLVNSFSADNGFDADLDRLLSLLPEQMREAIKMHPEFHGLIEVVMDFGRKPVVRFPSGDFVLSDCPITFQDIEYATSQVGDFAIDNRAGISCTLHRISAIRNRKRMIIGLTFRVGRAISGSADLLRDLVKDGASLLLIGPPGVGKTTVIREIARMLADEYGKRVMIVDTSNEIGGDGDIPHAGIGSARRMQVPDADMQHKVMIEAVENHMPEVIVIDEIGTKLEAMAASTIAQRGIQLVGTAHGITIENLIMNPSLEMLVGGIQSVTLGDEEASRRRVQKTVLERRGPPTFSCGVELISKSELQVHRDLGATVDAILSGRNPYYEVRVMNLHQVNESKEEEFKQSSGDQIMRVTQFCAPLMTDERLYQSENSCRSLQVQALGTNSRVAEVPLFLFVYGILEATVTQGIKRLKLDNVKLTDNISEADVLLALQSKIRNNTRILAAVKAHGLPVYVTKTSSLVQVTKAIRTLMSNHEDKLKKLDVEDGFINASEQSDALEEARLAIEETVILKGEAVELLPRPSNIVSLQVDLVQKYQLQCEIVGPEGEARLRIFPYHSKISRKQSSRTTIDAASGLEDFISRNGSTNDPSYNVNKLPLLPDYPLD